MALRLQLLLQVWCFPLVQHSVPCSLLVAGSCRGVTVIRVRLQRGLTGVARQLGLRHCFWRI